MRLIWSGSNRRRVVSTDSKTRAKRELTAEEFVPELVWLPD